MHFVVTQLGYKEFHIHTDAFDFAVGASLAEIEDSKLDSLLHMLVASPAQPNSTKLLHDGARHMDNDI